MTPAACFPCVGYSITRARQESDDGIMPGKQGTRNEVSLRRRLSLLPPLGTAAERALCFDRVAPGERAIGSLLSFRPELASRCGPCFSITSRNEPVRSAAPPPSISGSGGRAHRPPTLPSAVSRYRLGR